MDVPKNRNGSTPWWTGLGMFLMVIVTSILSVPPPKEKPYPGTATTCQLTVMAQTQQADVIVSGTVFMIIPGGVAGAQVIVQPDHVYKGTVQRPTLVINALNDLDDRGRTANVPSDLHFQTGQPPYLLFLRQHDVDSYDTRVCEGTRFLGTGLTPAEQTVIDRYDIT